MLKNLPNNRAKKNEVEYLRKLRQVVQKAHQNIRDSRKNKENVGEKIINEII